MATEKLKGHKSRGTDQIPAELIKAGGRNFTLRSTNLLLLCGIRRNCLRSGRSRSLYLSIIRAIKQAVVIIEAYQFAKYVQKFSQHPAVKVNFTCRGNYWGSSVWISMQRVNY
jgi:hypothetical protein